jgi:hypothetical protein
VSLPTDIIQLFGTGSVPVVVAGTVLGVFELGERFASPRAKDALSKWLLSFNIQKAKVLPDGTKELFEKIFGERHFSLKCFVRSAAFSLGAIAFVSIVRLLINPHPSEVFEPGRGPASPYWTNWMTFGTVFGLWLPWSIVIDYISLFKTRLILVLLLRMHRGITIVAIAILAMDYIVYIFIFSVGIALALDLRVVVVSTNLSITGFFDLWFWYVIFYVKAVISDFPTFLTSIVGLEFVWFWSGFAPSIWMWLYVLALFVTRLLLRSEKLVNWLRWALDIEKNPFRSIGAVAATLAFLGSVVIILVSAELSNISSAL